MNEAAPMTVNCPTCGTGFPVDPDRVPVGGVLAICSVCSRAFPVERPAGWVSSAPTAWSPGVSDGPVEVDAEFEVDSRPQVEEAAAVVEEVQVEEVFGTEADGRVGDVPDDDADDVADDDTDDVADGDADEVAARGALEDAEDGPGSGGEPGGEPGPEVDADTAVEGEIQVREGVPEAAGDAGDARDADEPTREPVEADAGRDTAASAASPFVPGASATGAAATAPSVGGTTAADADNATTGKARFGFRDPANRARRLARVLSSDMITYNPARYAEARRNGNLRDDFRDEIEKSWEEYVEQVGEEFATSTHHFADALNEVLAQGEKLFDGPGFPY